MTPEQHTELSKALADRFADMSQSGAIPSLMCMAQEAVTFITPAIQALEWNYDMEASPRDGTYVHVFVKSTMESFVVFWATSLDTDKSDWVIARASDGTCFVLRDTPTAWRIIDLPEGDQ